MKTTMLLDGAVHALPDDLRQALGKDATVADTWKDITPLARTEWICLVTSAKQDETRLRRIKRTVDQLSLGQRRPCCWQGCPHREKITRPSAKSSA